MARTGKVLINLHSTGTSAPEVDLLNFGEIAISHSSRTDAAIYTKVGGAEGASEVAKFINEEEVNRRISGYTDGKYDELAGIVQALADISVTEVNGATPISATTAPIGASQSGNAVTIYHKGDFTAQSGFKKLESDVYGHVTAGTDVTMSDISALTGFDTAVKAVETKLSYSSAGTGNAITQIEVSDHAITATLGKSFSEDDHTHDASGITSGVLDIARIPTAPVSSSASGTVATGEQIQEAIDNALTSSMNYKGATATLPSTAKTGDFYIASADIEIPAGSSATGAAASAETGDYIIARTSGASPTWDVVEKNLDGAVTSTGLTDGEIVIADGNGRAIKSVSASTLMVGSAITAISADTAESAITAISADTIDLSGVQSADDLKAIEALEGTEGVLKKTAANTWELVDVIDTVADFSGLTASGSLVDAKVVKDVIVENERITSAALNDLNDRLGGLSSSTIVIEDRVDDLENVVEELSGAVSSLTFTQYASAITVNGTQHTVANNGVDLGNYLSGDTKININGADKSVSNGVYDLGTFLSGSTQYVSNISQATTASAVTTTFTIANPTGATSTYDVVQDIVIDCGTY